MKYLFVLMGNKILTGSTINLNKTDSNFAPVVHILRSYIDKKTRKIEYYEVALQGYG